MNKATSLYLDVVRFLAALVVMVSHAKGYVGGLLWRFDEAFGAEAVTVFFVLSGFVIAHATATRETTMRDYAIARVSRIYSVALPALVLTALADQIGHSISPKLYAAALWACTVCSQVAAGGEVHVFDTDNFVASALFVNELWWLRLDPGTNGPYWSLGYEVWYYALFAVLTFFSGKPRLVLVLAVMVFVGPGILALWPLWLLGVWAYRQAPLSRRQGIALIGVSLLAWGAYEAVAWRFGRLDLPILFLKRPSLLQDYIVGLCFTGSLIGFRSVSEGMQIRRQWRPVRWLAGATFSVYLFHMPLLVLFATVNPWAARSWSGRAFVLGATLLSVFALAEVTERRKADWRRLVSWLFRDGGNSDNEVPAARGTFPAAGAGPYMPHGEQEARASLAADGRLRSGEAGAAGS